MSVLLGGRAAEEIVFGSITTGASDDLLARRGDLALDGPRLRDGHLDHLAQGVRRGRRRSPTAPASCATRSSSTSPTRRCAGPMRLIVEHRTKLDQLAGALLRNEVLERSDIDRIMEGVPRFHRSPGQGLRVVAAHDSRPRTRRHSGPGHPSGAPQVRSPRADARGDGRPPCPPVRRRARASTSSASCSPPGAIRAVFQPIVRLADLQPIGYEGLARFPTPPGLVALPPDVTLAAAGRLGVREELEVACWAAISEAGRAAGRRLLFVNVAPDALGHPGLLELAERLPARLVIELTEQDAIQNTVQLRERLRPWIARGALVAVDDAGAGFTSLEYVAELRPDFLKLCRGMVTGVDLDPSRQAVLRATVAFAREVGARVVAEGVERPEELAVPARRRGRLRPGLAVRPPRPRRGPRSLLPPGARRARPPGPARARARRRHQRPRGLGGGRRAPRPQGPDAERLPRGRRPPALPGGARLLADLRRHARDGRRDRAHLPHRRGRRSSRTSPTAASTCSRSPRSTPRSACRCASAGPSSACSITESPTQLGEHAVAEVRRCAALLSARLEALGGLASVSPAQRLARIAVRLGSLETAEDIVRETVAAARGLAGFESAMLALPDGDGGLLRPPCGGSFAVALGRSEGPELQADRRLGHDGDLSLHRQADTAGAASRATSPAPGRAPTP
jgi:EAL domain-containing protein (putative c-di-GMP-specific phosphodiesterase class I)